MKEYSRTFSVFYKTPIEIYRVISNSAYDREAETELICSVLADVQPLDGDLAEKDFGNETKKRFKVFSSSCEEFHEGRFVKLDEVMYKIVRVQKYDTGITAVIEGVTDCEY